MKSSVIKYFVILACVSMGLYTTSCKQANADEGKKIPFSHETHVQKYDIKDCGTCHKYDVTGVFKGLPSVGECTQCHRGNGDLFTDDRTKNPRKKTMFDGYTDKDRPWDSGKEAEFFYYSHKVKVNTNVADEKTKLRCDLCHADKAISAGKPHVKGEKLMEQCIYCHTSYKLNNQCDVCHR